MTAGAILRSKCNNAYSLADQVFRVGGGVQLFKSKPSLRYPPPLSIKMLASLFMHGNKRETKTQKKLFGIPR